MDNIINNQNLTSIMNRIQTRRLELKLSYQDLANKTNMSKSTLQRYETGSIKNMPIDKLGVISSALDVDPMWILGFNSKITSEYTEEEKEYLKNFRQLNMIGRNKVKNYTSDLIDSGKYIKSKTISLKSKNKEIWEEIDKDHLIPNAACEMEGNFTKEDYEHDEAIMKNDDFWNK